MLLTTLGTPSAFAAWGTLLLRSIVEVSRGKFQYIAAGKFEDLEKAFGARTNDQVIIYSDSPDAKMTALLMRVKAPATIFVEEPSDVVGYAAKVREMETRKAVRLACLSYSCLSAFNESPTAKVFLRRKHTSVRRLLMAMAGHYGLPMREADIETVLARVIKGYRKGDDPTVESQIVANIANAKPAGQWVAEFDAEDADLLETALQPYYEIAEGRLLSQVMWPPQLFHDGSEKGTYLSGAIELVGRSRCLIHGPFLHLPRGRWNASVQINVGEGYSRNTIVVDVKCGDILTSGRMALPDSGSFIFSIPFVVTDPRAPIQIRFFLEKGAIEGWIDLVSVMIERDRAEAA